MTTRLTYVMFFWQDAADHGTRQMTREDYVESEGGLLSGASCGWLVNETDTYVAIATDYFYDGHQESFRGVATYPKSGISRIYRSVVPITTAPNGGLRKGNQS